MNIVEIGISFLICYRVAVIFLAIISILVYSIFEKSHHVFLNSGYSSIIIDKETNKKHFVPYDKWICFLFDTQYDCPLHYRKVKNSDIKKMQKISEVFPATDEMLKLMAERK